MIRRPLHLLIPMCMFSLLLLNGAFALYDHLVEIDSRFVHDEQDRNEWGPSLGGEEIQAEWGELVVFRALPTEPIDRRVIFLWEVTNLMTGESEVFEGPQIQIRFFPSDRNLSRLQEEKFMVAVTVFYSRGADIASWSSIQLWVTSDDDNDNDGMPDERERYYWNENIIHHHPEYDEDGDGLTNSQEIGFDIPLSNSERSIPYSPPYGHFDPSDPNSPYSNNTGKTFVDGDGPNGPVMTSFQAYLLMGGIISLGVAAVMVDVIYIKFFYTVPYKPVPDLPSIEDRMVRGLHLVDLPGDKSAG